MYIKILVLILCCFPSHLKAKTLTNVEERQINADDQDAKNPEMREDDGQQRRGLSLKDKSFSHLTKEYAKQHLIDLISHKSKTIKDYRDEVNENSPSKCSKIIKVGKPIVHHHSGATQGTWMRDPSGVMGAEKIWYASGYYGYRLLEFETMNHFKAGMVSKTYNLPYYFDGTGAVVYGRYFYYNRASTNKIVQYDLIKGRVVRTTTPHSSISSRTYTYNWGGYTTFDLSIDESGLWALYSYSSYSGKLCATQLDPINLSSLKTFCGISSEKMGYMGNAFVACGIVYSIDSYSSKSTTINYAYDTANYNGYYPYIKFENKFGYNSMVTYNPREKVLYAWDRNRQITYPLEFEEST